jgi:hypothetical protein
MYVVQNVGKMQTAMWKITEHPQCIQTMQFNVWNQLLLKEMTFYS